VHQLEIKVLNIIDARFDHDVIFVFKFVKP